MSGDHQGHFDINTCIRVGNALERFNMAALEDFLPWDLTEQWKTLTDSINTPTVTGEDIYLKEAFINLCDAHAVDIVQPDMGSSGGILETKKIGDYAEEKDTAMIMHFAGTQYVSWPMYIWRLLRKMPWPSRYPINVPTIPGGLIWSGWLVKNR
ncbi:MAG: hypothetical protein IPO69_17420 [Saprospiraceae bacterium]|nr:hypothetical protein [Saprospiraceae bacterium]